MEASRHVWSSALIDTQTCFDVEGRDLVPRKVAVGPSPSSSS